MSVFRTLAFIAARDLRHMLRARETLLWTFGMPVVFFFFIGTITGGVARPGSETRDPLVVETPAGAGFLADALVARLGGVGFRPVPAESAGASVPHLAVPPAFTDSVLAGGRGKLTYTREESGLSGDYDGVRIRRAAYALLGDVVAAAERSGSVTPASLAEVQAEPRTLTLEVARAGRRKVIPSGFEQAIPGTMVMFTLLVLLTSGATLLVLERDAGLLRRLASSPLPRSGIILGKWAGRMALGLVQIGFAMLVGTALFHVGWGPHFGALAAVLLVYAALVAVLGILLGNLARTQGQAVGIGILAANFLAALGGCWWPIEITPPWMQHLAIFLPTGLAMNALHKLVSFGAPAGSVVPHVLILAAAALAGGWLAARTFRFQ